MPFIFFALILIDFARNKINNDIIFLTTTLISLVYFSTIPIWRAWSLQPPYGQYVHALGGVFIGILLGSHRPIKYNKYFAGILAVIFIILCININIAGIGIPFLLAIVLCMVIFYFKSNILWRCNLWRISECTLGVYLIHPLVFSIIYKIGPLNQSALAFATFVASITSVFAARSFFPILAKRIT